MQVLHIGANIYLNSQSIMLSLNCADKQHTIVV